MAYIYNNPNSTSILSDTSLIRIYLPFSAISEYQFTQDYTDSSVLNGFSATGGLWTFLGSIIALLFGRTIMQSIVGMSAYLVFKSATEITGLDSFFFRLETSFDLRTSSYGG